MAWKRARDGVGKAKECDDFRRTAVKSTARVGIPERVAQQLSVHNTRAVFDRSHIIGESDLREATKRWARYAMGWIQPRASAAV